MTTHSTLKKLVSYTIQVFRRCAGSQVDQDNSGSSAAELVPEPTPAPVLPGFLGEAFSVAPSHSAMGAVPAFRSACRSIRHQIQAVTCRLHPLPAMHPSPALASMPESAQLTRAETPPPAGTLVAPVTPGGNSPATPAFAGILRDKFPGNPSIGQHNPNALCYHDHRQTPDARHADSYPGAPATHRRSTAWEIRLPVRQRTPLQPCPSCQEEACPVAPNTGSFVFSGEPPSIPSPSPPHADNFRTIR